MSDQQAPSREDSPAVAGPAGDTGAQEQAEIDWQKRYVDTQAEYSRGQQRLAELENQQQWYELALTSEDEDTRRQAIEALGYALPDDDDVDDDAGEEFEPAEYQDPYDELSARQQALEQHIVEQDQQAEQESEAALIRAITDERLGQLEGLSEADQNWVLAYALTLDAVQEPGVPVPLPDIGQAYEAYVARETERQKQWAKTKRAPFVAPGGREATQVPDTSTHDGRVDAILRRMQDAEDVG